MHDDSKNILQWKTALLSYSHKDEELATNLYRLLESNGIDVWFAPYQVAKNIEAGKLMSIIGDEVRRRDLILLITTENSVRSWWVEKEINFFFDTLSEEILIEKVIIILFSEHINSQEFIGELFSDSMLARMTICDLISKDSLEESAQLLLKLINK